MQFTKDQQEQLNKIFEKNGVILAYVFGSAAKGETGPLSDYDFAFYVDTRDTKAIFDLKIKLILEIGRVLGTDKLDVVALNTAASPELKYNIIKEGKIIYEKEPFRILVEPRILNEYFDFHALLLRHHLTKII